MPIIYTEKHRDRIWSFRTEIGSEILKNGNYLGTIWPVQNVNRKSSIHEGCSLYALKRKQGKPGNCSSGDYK